MIATTQLSSNFDQIDAGADFRQKEKREKANTVDYQSFMKLLVAQMKYQDPSSPLDATQYVSQLASFSALEQAMQTNKKLDQLLADVSVSQAGSYVGKYVASNDGKTAGIIQSIRIFRDGLVAILNNGGQLSIGPDITISDKVPVKA